jgi:hypothetical protein
MPLALRDPQFLIDQVPKQLELGCVRTAGSVAESDDAIVDVRKEIHLCTVCVHAARVEEEAMPFIGCHEPAESICISRVSVLSIEQLHLDCLWLTCYRCVVGPRFQARERPRCLDCVVALF